MYIQILLNPAVPTHEQTLKNTPDISNYDLDSMTESALCGSVKLKWRYRRHMSGLYRTIVFDWFFDSSAPPSSSLLLLSRSAFPWWKPVSRTSGFVSSQAVCFPQSNFWVCLTSLKHIEAAAESTAHRDLELCVFMSLFDLTRNWIIVSLVLVFLRPRLCRLPDSHRELTTWNRYDLLLLYAAGGQTLGSYGNMIYSRQSSLSKPSGFTAALLISLCRLLDSQSQR